MNFKKRPRCVIDARFMLASVPHRIFAMMLDIAAVALLMLGILLIIYASGIDINLNIENMFASHPELEIDSEDMGNRMKDFLKIFFGFFPMIYFFLATYLSNGLTVGKKITGIRIVSLYHTRVGLWHCLERSLGYVASTLELGLGFIQILWNPNRMALHDKIAETIVIRTVPGRKLQAKTRKLK
ncbi:MAG TPA: RDD family protein [Bacteroidales bacterium]|nr:RDD family protein [Bacteroidales bacterium]